MTVPVHPADGALGLYSAVGDALAGRGLGFGRRRAALAAGFARHRGEDDESVTASWCAGLLAEIGALAVVVAADAGERRRSLALADAPLFGARIAAGIPGLPPSTGDLIRWHREHDDGTGFPDRLRWDGIPRGAAALGIVHAFRETVEDPQEPRPPGEALFAILAEAGRRFPVELVRAFREYVVRTGAEENASDEPRLSVPDDDALVAELAARLDARDPSTARRSERIAQIAAQIAERMALDGGAARRLGRLFALSGAVAQPDYDAFDPLSRFARERRGAAARRAASIAQAVPRFAPDAPALAASAHWYEERAGDPLAAVLGVAIALDALPPRDAPRLIAAAAGTQFDPAVVQAYLAAPGLPT